MSWTAAAVGAATAVVLIGFNVLFPGPPIRFDTDIDSNQDSHNTNECAQGGEPPQSPSSSSSSFSGKFSKIDGKTAAEIRRLRAEADATGVGSLSLLALFPCLLMGVIVIGAAFALNGLTDGDAGRVFAGLFRKELDALGFA